MCWQYNCSITIVDHIYFLFTASSKDQWVRLFIEIKASLSSQVWWLQGQCIEMGTFQMTGLWLHLPTLSKCNLSINTSSLDKQMTPLIIFNNIFIRFWTGDGLSHYKIFTFLEEIKHLLEASAVVVVIFLMVQIVSLMILSFI